MTLTEIISPYAFVSRSVNLERDIDDENTLDQYILTGKGLEIIRRLVSGLTGERVSAWSLTGPYGMGKSSFVNFLLALCGPLESKETKKAKSKLKQQDAHLLEKFESALDQKFTKGFFRVPVTSSFQPLNHTLATGLQRSLRNTTLIDRASAEILHSKLQALIDKQQIDTRQLMAIFEDTARLAGVPVAIAIDELGKNLEYMARYHGGQGDIYMLQTLAEHNGIYLWVCLHQGFEEYSSGLTARQLQEWGKIQGRFEDISFVEPASQMVDFIGKALKRTKKHLVTEDCIYKWAEQFYLDIQRLNLTEFYSINADIISGFYPLHPLVAMSLPELCVRFAQNDRTLFAFLCGGEPAALPAFLSYNHMLPEQHQMATSGPEYLYDYFLASNQSISLHRPESRRWIEINNMVLSAKALPELEYRIAKLVGLLNLISGPSGYRASNHMLCFALLRPFAPDPVSEVQVNDALNSLRHRGLLNYREYADEYRLWEGTDFDIVAAISAQKERLNVQPVVELLDRTIPLAPLTASRHSYETGTLRHFERQWFDAGSIGLNEMKCSSEDMDGLILYCIGNEDVPQTF